MNCPRQAAWKKGEWQRTSSCAAKSRCSRPTTRVMIDEVNVLKMRVSDRINDCVDDQKMAYLPSGGGPSSVGGFRKLRSRLFFDTA